MEEKNLKILSHFDAKYKGVVFNTILFYIRKGGKYADQIIDLIQKKLEIQRRWGLENTNAEWDRYFKEIDLNTQLKEFYEIMEHAEEWEKKPREEKEKIKAEQAKYFVKQSMKGKEPTEKQIKFLKSKGLKDIPNDRFECSEIIDKLMK